MARYSKDRGARSISIGPAIAATAPNENANTTPKNPGTATGAGDEFVYIPGEGQAYQYPTQIAWDVVVNLNGGTLSALTVALEISDDGVNWNQLDTQNSTTGGRKVVQNTLGRMFRGNITTYTVTGSPIISVGISA